MRGTIELFQRNEELASSGERSKGHGGVGPAAYVITISRVAERKGGGLRGRLRVWGVFLVTKVPNRWKLDET